MKTLKLNEIKPGDVVVFVDSSLNAEGAHVDQRRMSVPLDGVQAVVVAVDSRDDHAATCALKTKTVTRMETVDGKSVAITEHAACDCGFAPGRRVALALKKPHPQAHSCGGLVPNRTEVEVELDVDAEVDGKKTKAKQKAKQMQWHGVFAHPEHVYSLASYEAHKAASKVAAEKSVARNAEIEKAAAIAKKFIEG